MDQDKIASKISNASNDVRSRVKDVVHNASDYVDQATTSVGRGLETAADSMANRAQSMSDGIARTGRYLQSSDTEQMGRDLTNWVRENPAVSLALGFGIGFMIGRMLSPRSA